MKSVQGKQSGDEIRRDTFQIVAELNQSDIATQETFVDALEKTQKRADFRPHAFAGVNVTFADAVAVIIPCRFIFRLMDSGLRTNNVIVANHSPVEQYVSVRVNW